MNGLPGVWTGAPFDATRRVRLDRVELFEVHVPRKASLSRKVVTATPQFACALHAGGLVGWGEASARFRAVDAAHEWAVKLVRQELPLLPDPFGPLSVIAADEDGPILDTTRRWLAPLREYGSVRAYRVADRLQLPWRVFRSRQQRIVREAYSIAWYDLVGQLTGQSVPALLGGARRRTMRGIPVVHVYKPEVAATRAAEWVDLGFGFIKLKIAGSLDADRRRVEAVRSRIGPDIGLQVDANYGFRRLRDVRGAMRSFADLGVDLIEDPIMASLREYAELAAGAPIRLMVDGKAWWPNIRNVCRLNAAHIVNHHSNRQGGLDWAVAIATTAEACGIDSSIGSGGLLGIQCAGFESLATRIGLGRPCEAMIQGAIGPAEDRQRFAWNPSVVRELYPVRQGTIEVPDAPGLGIAVDTDLLRERASRVLTIDAAAMR